MVKMFEHFVGLALKGLNTDDISFYNSFKKDDVNFEWVQTQVKMKKA